MKLCIRLIQIYKIQKYWLNFSIQLNVKPTNSQATYRFDDTAHLNMEIIEDRRIFSQLKSSTTKTTPNKLT